METGADRIAQFGFDPELGVWYSRDCPSPQLTLAQRRVGRRTRMFRAARLIVSGRGAVRVPVRRVRVSPHSTYLGVQLTS